MNNTAWQRARREAGLRDLHVHDLRHTVGLRLREANVEERTISDILWHTRSGMTAHYSVAQVREIHAALELIADERHGWNKTLASIAQDAVGIASPHAKKKRIGASTPNRLIRWRARQDLNPRPPGS